MALSKIRPLWPDFWTDDKIVALSPFARLFYQGLWTYACDNGHLEDRSRQLKRLILPDDDVNAADLLTEIHKQGLVERVDGWLIVTGAAARWKTDWRYFKTCDRPECEKPERETRRGNDVATPGPQGDNGRTRRDHATEGVRVRDGVRDGDGEEKTPSPSADAERGREDVEAVCQHLSDSLKARGVKQHKTTDTWRKTARLMIDRDGYTETQVKWLIDHAAADEFWGRNILSMPTLRKQADRLVLQFRGNVTSLRPGEAPGVTYLADGTVDLASLPPVEPSWMRRSPS